MVKKQPSQFSFFVQLILSIIFIISLSACLFLGKLEYMVPFLAIGLVALTVYFIKWLIKSHPDFVSGLYGFGTKIVIIIAILGFIACLLLGEFKLMLVIVILALMVVVILNLLNADSGREPSNATLTCKNGHTCRVWVDLTRWESVYFPGNPGAGEMIYNVDGHDIRRKSRVMPECCPKCGAEWLVPNKHKGRK